MSSNERSNPKIAVSRSETISAFRKAEILFEARPWLGGALLLLVFFGVYGVSLCWGWLGYDDNLLLQRNPHLGHGFSSWLWGLSDVGFGRRWTPAFWTLANLWGLGGIFGYHLGALVMTGWALWALWRWLLELGVKNLKAFFVGLIFVLSPLRWETAGWAIGFLYGFLAVCCIEAARAYLRGQNSRSAVWMLLALLAYPQAAGIALLGALLRWRTWQGKAIILGVFALGALQMHLRVTIGFSDFAPRPQMALWVIPHYLLVQVFPWATVPIVPSEFYGLAILGAIAAIALAIFRPQPMLWLVALLSPTVLAASTEAFWWAARYGLLVSVWFAVMIARERWGLWAKCAVILLLLGFALTSVPHRAFRSQLELIARARAEAWFMYRDPETDHVFETIQKRVASREAEAR